MVIKNKVPDIDKKKKVVGNISNENIEDNDWSSIEANQDWSTLAVLGYKAGWVKHSSYI